MHNILLLALQLHLHAPFLDICAQLKRKKELRLGYIPFSTKKRKLFPFTHREGNYFSWGICITRQKVALKVQLTEFYPSKMKLAFIFSQCANLPHQFK